MNRRLIEPWVSELIERGTRRGFAAGAIVTGILWILCTLGSR